MSDVVNENLGTRSYILSFEETPTSTTSPGCSSREKWFRGPWSHVDRTWEVYSDGLSTYGGSLEDTTVISSS